MVTGKNKENEELKEKIKKLEEYSYKQEQRAEKAEKQSDYWRNAFVTLQKELHNIGKQICYKSNKICKYNCSGLCKESV